MASKYMLMFVLCLLSAKVCNSTRQPSKIPAPKHTPEPAEEDEAPDMNEKEGENYKNDDGADGSSDGVDPSEDAKADDGDASNMEENNIEEKTEGAESTEQNQTEELTEQTDNVDAGGIDENGLDEDGSKEAGQDEAGSNEAGSKEDGSDENGPNGDGSEEKEGSEETGSIEEGDVGEAEDTPAETEVEAEVEESIVEIPCHLWLFLQNLSSTMVTLLDDPAAGPVIIHVRKEYSYTIRHKIGSKTVTELSSEILSTMTDKRAQLTIGHIAYAIRMFLTSNTTKLVRILTTQVPRIVRAQKGIEAVKTLRAEWLNMMADPPTKEFLVKFGETLFGSKESNQEVVVKGTVEGRLKHHS